MFELFKNKADQAKVTLHKVENRDLMEAIVAGAFLVAFTDGDEAFIIAIEIADADGNIDENELKVLKEIGRAFGLNRDNYI
ncbi:hypothetical protein KSS82_11645 [Vibrio mimicus]|nr:TerB family tellurite resistance protein [Vibrio mimicus]QXC58689.1 hypothetical protein KSS82_11645 [Vibrio mimicus]